ncbi:MAG: cold-shock protein [Candidatus Latescibacterota bacterium]|jgi:CspA family cold shock protein
MAERETGTVKWFDNAKGWGFITRGSGDDVFVHYTSVRGEGYRTLEDGQQVEFEVAQGAKGLQAQDVIVVH